MEKEEEESDEEFWKGINIEKLNFKHTKKDTKGTPKSWAYLHARGQRKAAGVYYSPNDGAVKPYEEMIEEEEDDILKEDA